MAEVCCCPSAESQLKEAAGTGVTSRNKAKAQRAQAPWDDSAAEQDTIPALGGSRQATSVITAPDFGGAFHAIIARIH